MAFEGWTGAELESFRARCRNAVETVSVEELENCRTIMEEQTGVSALNALLVLTSLPDER